ncbi:DUF4291 domain-containing protein [Conchiformibius steedae DSM 2580]|uniref:DUF4291 domain-containing protein n=1 Tax=Conchiformibius steedae DSM 2580 TaxID=1121352 RepID=A0AAE9HSZ8_9NEIS|nr:DUF4291 domain-containing protein [Conchiformibius steedae]URD67114.1 DUF4291 domain-containing protein [Conchiformibius steedae DSM 2580]
MNQNSNLMPNGVPVRQIRAVYDNDTIRVYQAYSDAIADTALANGRFVSPLFKMTRMTWIKPSFLWMMYRAGWGLKDAGQKRILAIDIRRDGFEWALAHAIGSRKPDNMDAAQWQYAKETHPVRIQWDPERDIHLQPLPYRAIQIGLTGEAVQHYVNDWIVSINEVTDTAHRIRDLVVQGETAAAAALLPVECEYPYINLR